MTSTTTSPTSRPSDPLVRTLRPVRRLPGVTGVVVATMDGRTHLTDLDEATPGAAAAVAASSVGLGTRLGELSETEATLLELQVRSTAGYVCLYVVNTHYLLGVVATHAVNLARLKLEVRDVIVAVDELLPADADRRPDDPGQ